MPPEAISQFDLSRVFVLLHWAGMLLGLGSAAVADALGARVLLSARPGPKPGVLLALHLTIGVAMLLLLFSGTGLIVLRSEAWCALPDNVLRFGSFCLPYKLAVKLVLMSVLICVALMIESFLLPMAQRRERPLIFHLSAFELARATAIVSASFTCWLTLAAIPQIKAVHSWPPHEFLPRVVAMWLVLATASFVGAVTLRRALSFRTAGGPNHTVRSDGAATSSADRLGVAPLRLAGARQPIGAAGAARSPARTGNAAPPAVAAARLLRPALSGAFAISFVINALMLTGPIYMLQVYDRVLTSRSSETLMVLTVLIVGLFAVMGFLDVIRSRILSRLAIQLDAVLARPLLAAAVRVEARQTRNGAVPPVRDLDQIRQFVAGPAVPALLDLPWAPFYFLLVFVLHPVLGIVAVAGATVLVTLSVLSQSMTRNALAQSAEACARSDGLVEAGWRGAETLRALGMNAAFRRRWLEEHREALQAQLRAGDCAARISTSIRVARMLLQSVLLGVGAWLALHDAVSAGAMIAVSIVAGRALVPVEQIVAHWRGIAGVTSAVKRCRSCLAADVTVNGSIDLPRPRGELSVTGLYVTPLGGSQPVVKGLSFRLSPGDAMAVVGPSASGKSTLARALVGVWPVRAGEIRLDGATLSQWDPEALGRYVGYLPQDALLFDGTISENIARLEPNADPAAVIAAARAAGVHEMILRLEHGYATRVGEGGAALSGGQRQRIALARALFGNPVLVVMDEPNSNLDAAGENALIEAIALLRAARCTVVVMAHRRSVLAAVNRVLVINEGRQTSFGAPDKVFKPETPKTNGATNDNLIKSVRVLNKPAR